MRGNTLWSTCHCHMGGPWFFSQVHPCKVVKMLSLRPKSGLGQPVHDIIVVMSIFYMQSSFLFFVFFKWEYEIVREVCKPCSCGLCTERWLGWRDWPKILCQCVRVWCGEELWVSDTGDCFWHLLKTMTVFHLYIHPFSSSLSVPYPLNSYCCVFLLITSYISVSISSTFLSVYLFQFFLIPTLLHHFSFCFLFL